MRRAGESRCGRWTAKADGWTKNRYLPLWSKTSNQHQRHSHAKFNNTKQPVRDRNSLHSVKMEHVMLYIMSASKSSRASREDRVRQQ